MEERKPFLVVIPAFNEERNIGNVLQGLLAMNLETDILVVNDGSKDETAKEASKYPVTVLSHPCNLGYGAALHTGYQYANEKGYPYLIQFDSDGQHNPSDLPAIMKTLAEGGADIVMGSRFLGNDQHFDTGIVKEAGIRFFRMLIKRLTGQYVSDPTSGLRGVSRNVFTYYSGKNRFPADFPDADILIHQILLDFRLKEVPAHMKQREIGVSMHAGLKPILYMMQIMLSILIVMIRHKREKRMA